MTSSSDDKKVRPVLFSRGRDSAQASLRYDEETGMVTMDPFPLKKLGLGDFRRIHGFFRRLQTMKSDLTQEADDGTRAP